ncbi:MAG TPA: hypothetical protein V6D27_16860 [Vampirovibrionales bacterium]
MLEMLLLDIFVIFAVLWFIADPNKPKPVMRRPKKTPSLRRTPSVFSGTSYAEPQEMTAELMPKVSEWRSPDEASITPHPDSTGSELVTPSAPLAKKTGEKKSVRNQSKQVTTQPMPGEAQWGSVSTK